MRHLANLLSQYKLNDLFTLKNRIIMAPMTRAKAHLDGTPTHAMVAYYARRAEAGLIITEGTVIGAKASGYISVPGIYTLDQIKHWLPVTQAVQARGGLIFSQIWHVGRVSHPDFLNGELPISASETVMTSRVYRSPGLTYGKSRAATLTEIHDIIAQYAQAAKNAMEAGFDGVEIHGANGYLIDQFLHHHTNLREDEYGGNKENMARFALEVVNACGAAIGYERVAIRLSPGAYLNEIVGDMRDGAVFQYLLEQLNTLPIAFVHTGSFNDADTYAELNGLTMTQFLRKHFKGTVIGCGSYTFEKADKQIADNDFDLVAIGRPFIANPDLIHRLQTQQPLKSYDASMLEELI